MDVLGDPVVGWLGDPVVGWLARCAALHLLPGPGADNEDGNSLVALKPERVQQNLSNTCWHSRRLLTVDDVLCEEAFLESVQAASSSNPQNSANPPRTSVKAQHLHKLMVTEVAAQNAGSASE